MPNLMPSGGDPGIARTWKYQQIMRSAMWGVGGVVKNRLAFGDHTDPDALLALLEEAAGRECARPSSYADLFHKAYHTGPKPSGPVSRVMQSFEVNGGWQELLVPRSTLPGIWRKYDIRSAYLWSLMQGLPNPKTFRYSEHFGNKNGLYVADILPALHAPFPFRNGGKVTLTSQEAERYNLTITRLYHGITWTPGNVFTLDEMVSAILGWSCWKQIARGFWGRWASRGDVTCTTWKKGERSKEWDLPNRTFNPIWAHLIVSRVRERLHEVVSSAPTARVYVDSVITTAELPDSGGIGGWRLEQEFNGLEIRHLNIYRSVA